MPPYITTRTFVRGRNYEIKDQLKALGLRWDPRERAWYTDVPAVAVKALRGGRIRRWVEKGQRFTFKPATWIT